MSFEESRNKITIQTFSNFYRVYWLIQGDFIETDSFTGLFDLPKDYLNKKIREDYITLLTYLFAIPVAEYSKHLYGVPDISYGSVDQKYKKDVSGDFFEDRFLIRVNWDKIMFDTRISNPLYKGRLRNYYWCLRRKFISDSEFQWKGSGRSLRWLQFVLNKIVTKIK